MFSSPFCFLKIFYDSISHIGGSLFVHPSHYLTGEFFTLQEEAKSYYYRVLDVVGRHRSLFSADVLQRVHTLYNLACLVSPPSLSPPSIGSLAIIGTRWNGELIPVNNIIEIERGEKSAVEEADAEGEAEEEAEGEAGGEAERVPSLEEKGKEREEEIPKYSDEESNEAMRLFERCALLCREYVIGYENTWTLAHTELKKLQKEIRQVSVSCTGSDLGLVLISVNVIWIDQYCTILFYSVRLSPCGRFVFFCYFLSWL